MKTLTKMVCMAALCMTGFNAAQAATHAKKTTRATSEEAKQLAVCAKKSAGTPVMYSHGGVTFNGYCQPNANGKLQFMPPMPAGETAVMTTTGM